MKKQISSGMPEAFIQRLSLQFPESIVDTIVKSYDKKRCLSLRINTLKTTVSHLKKILDTLGYIYTTVPWSPVALILPNTTARELTDMESYQAGFFYIQNLSSMLPALVLNPQLNDVILDMAAAPGSKTTQIAALMMNTGTIFANDVSHGRLFKLKQNLQSQGVTNTEIKTIDGQSIWKKYPEFFDKVLVDVPCSLEGTINPADSLWSAKKVKRFSKMQKWLLRSAISCTKPGGIVVYSTCTLSVEENEENINWILDKEKDSVKLQPIFIDTIVPYPAFLSYKDAEFLPELSQTLRILPSETMEGFFVAKLKKIKSSLPSAFHESDL